MVEPYKLFGRLSNEMFIYAAWYAHARKNGIHFFAQDEKYFKEFEDEIRQLYGAHIMPNSVDRVAIHRRLTDYVGNSFYVDLGHHEHEKLEDNYFMRAMAEFPEGTKFTVFSDDLEKAKQEPMFQGPQFEFSEGKSAVDDLNYMACHKGHIISNSSFSWWGAYLGKWSGQLVVAPKQWFSNVENEQFIGIPESWKRI